MLIVLRTAERSFSPTIVSCYSSGSYDFSSSAPRSSGEHFASSLIEAANSNSSFYSSVESFGFS